MNTRHYTVLFLAAVAVSHSALALKLGKPEVQSHLGEPLSVRIPVSGESEDVLRQTQFGLAPYSQWQQAGMKLPPDDLDPRVQLRSAGDSPYVSITTNSPIREPILQLLLSYQINLDPVQKQSFTFFLDPAPPGDESEAVADADTGAAADSQPASAPSQARDEPAQAEPAAPEDSGSAAEAESTVGARPTPEGKVGDERYGPVGEGETLWSIAVRYSQTTGARLPDLVQALMESNPDAFAAPGDPGSLREGVYLDIPAEIPQRTARATADSAPAGTAAQPPGAGEDAGQSAGDDADTAPGGERTPAPGSGESVGPVGKGQTLWSIASRLSSDTEYVPQQFMLGLLASNPDAFEVEGNVNSLRHGVRLRVPGSEVLERYSQAEAVVEVQRQNRAWSDGTAESRSAPAPPEPAEPAATETEPGAGGAASGTVGDGTGPGDGLPTAGRGRGADDGGPGDTGAPPADDDSTAAGNGAPSTRSEPAGIGSEPATGEAATGEAATGEAAEPVATRTGAAGADEAPGGDDAMPGDESDSTEDAVAATGSGTPGGPGPAGGDGSAGGPGTASSGSEAEAGPGGAAGGEESALMDAEATVNEVLNGINQEQAETTAGTGGGAESAGAVAAGGADAPATEPTGTADGAGAAQQGDAPEATTPAAPTPERSDARPAPAQSGGEAPWWQFWRGIDGISMTALNRPMGWAAGGAVILLVLGVIFARSRRGAGAGQRRGAGSSRGARADEAGSGGSFADRLVRSTQTRAAPEVATAAAAGAASEAGPVSAEAAPPGESAPAAEQEDEPLGDKTEAPTIFDDSEWPAAEDTGAADEPASGDAEALADSDSGFADQPGFGAGGEDTETTFAEPGPAAPGADADEPEPTAGGEDEPVGGIDYEPPADPFGEDKASASDAGPVADETTESADRETAPAPGEEGAPASDDEDATQLWGGPDDLVEVGDFIGAADSQTTEPAAEESPEEEPAGGETPAAGGAFAGGADLLADDEGEDEVGDTAAGETATTAESGRSPQDEIDQWLAEHAGDHGGADTEISAQGEGLADSEELEIGDMPTAGDEGDAESELEAEAPAPSEPQAAVDSGELEDQPDLGSSEPDESGGAAGSGAPDSNSVEVKLDLARAYLSLGDREATESLLDEVIAEGSERQQMEAREMKDAI